MLTFDTLGSILTEQEAHAIYEQGREAVVFKLLELAGNFRMRLKSENASRNSFRVSSARRIR
ncbi:MAG: hypothetical protein AB9903_14235 [Vulcanimicrobiota bacterium]